MPNGKDPSEFINKLAESYRQVRFARGVVGKTSYVTGGLLALWGIIFWRLTGNLWPDLALFGGGLVVTGIYCWWVKGTQEFAKENPELALLEGAELLEYQKFEAQAKGILLIASSPPIIDPAAPTPIISSPQGPDK